MTARKPPGTSWESWVEAQIRVAMEQGAFDNLPGAGKPLPNLDQEHDPLWWVKQLVQREQISLLPPALELLRQVETSLGVAAQPMRPVDGAAAAADQRAVQGQQADARDLVGHEHQVALVDPDLHRMIEVAPFGEEISIAIEHLHPVVLTVGHQH